MYRYFAGRRHRWSKASTAETLDERPANVHRCERRGCSSTMAVFADEIPQADRGKQRAMYRARLTSDWQHKVPTCTGDP